MGEALKGSQGKQVKQYRDWAMMREGGREGNGGCLMGSEGEVKGNLGGEE